MTESTLPQDAITAALQQNWKEAIRINLAILKNEPKDIDALSRLAYAYLKTGQLTASKKTYLTILGLDQYNQIAQKNLKKISTIKKKDIDTNPTNILSPMMFLEEPGQTKVAECIHVAPAQVLLGLSAGQEVQLKAKNHCVEIRSVNDTYLAALPDDLSFKLIKLMSAGNTYTSVVKTVEKNSLKVFIRELTRGKRFAHQPSFTATTSYVPFTRGTVSQNDLPDVTPTGESDEHEEAPNEEDAP